MSHQTNTTYMAGQPSLPWGAGTREKEIRRWPEHRQQAKERQANIYVLLLALAAKILTVVAKLYSNPHSTQADGKDINTGREKNE